MRSRFLALFIALLLVETALAAGPTGLPPGIALPKASTPGVALPQAPGSALFADPWRTGGVRLPRDPGQLGPAPDTRAGAAEVSPPEVLPPEEVLQREARDLLWDGRLDEERRRELELRADELGIDRVEALALVEEIVQQRRDLLDHLFAQVRALSETGELTDEDRRFLETRGKDLGLGFYETSALISYTEDRVRRHTLFQSLIEVFLEDGLLDSSEQKKLEERRLALELTEPEHDEILERTRADLGDPARDVFREIRERDRALGPPEEELVLYGTDLFQGRTDPLTPAPGMTPPDTYMVGPGDRFQALLWGRLEADYVLAVDGEGKVQFPKIGPVRVGGLNYSEARRLLKRKAESITGVSAAITLAGLRSVQVFVVGEAARPGSVVLPPLSTVLHAVVAAGGPSPLGSLRSVLLRRAGKQMSTLDVYQFLETGAADGDLPLENGDVVVVPKARKLVQVFGKVRRPAIYELNGDEGLRALIRYAGGMAPDAYGGRLQLERSEQNRHRVVFDVAFSELTEGEPLEDGDTVRVFSLSPELENQVSLHGHVHQPGTYAHTEGMRIRDLISSVNQLKPDVDLAYAVVLRTDGPGRAKRTVPFVLGAALDHDDPEANILLIPGDEVYVFSGERFRPPMRAKVTGEARSPGVYRIEPGTRVADLVRLAGGLTSQALGGRGELLRYLPDRRRQTLYVDLTLAMAGEPDHNLELADEDEVVIHQVWDQTAEEVVLVEGEVNGTGDDRFRRGKSVQARFAELLEQERLQAEEEAQAEHEENSQALEPDAPEETQTTAPRPEPEPEPEREAIEIVLTRGMTIRDLVFKAGGLTKDAYLPVAHLYRADRRTKQVTIHTFRLGKALDGDPDENLRLQDLDHVVVHSAFEFVPVQRVSADGMVNQPGEFPYAQNMTVRDLVVTARGLREEAYRGQAEVVRSEVIGGEIVETRTLGIDLERAMAGDPDANLQLRPYDRLFVKEISNWKESRRVDLQGEVMFPGIYHVAKGEKLSSLLHRAGGFTAEAYLRGAVFTRERAREQQQQRLDELRDRLQQAILRASSEEAQAALSAEDVAAQKQYLSSQGALLRRLHASRATGRVVVKLLPLEELEHCEWDIPLEDGDTITVPGRPQTVSVVGAVYNPTSLLWEPGTTHLEHYLDRTGGPTPAAEEKEIYVVRADGTVVSTTSADSGNWWSRGILNLDLYPGDTILVPEKVLRINYMKEVRDITQILYQIAVTAGVAVVLL